MSKILDNVYENSQRKLFKLNNNFNVLSTGGSGSGNGLSREFLLKLLQVLVCQMIKQTVMYYNLISATFKQISHELLKKGKPKVNVKS